MRYIYILVTPMPSQTMLGTTVQNQHCFHMGKPPTYNDHIKNNTKNWKLKKKEEEER